MASAPPTVASAFPLAKILPSSNL